MDAPARITHKWYIGDNLVYVVKAEAGDQVEPPLELFAQARGLQQPITYIKEKS